MSGKNLPNNSSGLESDRRKLLLFKYLVSNGRLNSLYPVIQGAAKFSSSIREVFSRGYSQFGMQVDPARKCDSEKGIIFIDTPHLRKNGDSLATYNLMV